MRKPKAVRQVERFMRGVRAIRQETREQQRLRILRKTAIIRRQFSSRVGWLKYVASLAPDDHLYLKAEGLI